MISFRQEYQVIQDSCIEHIWIFQKALQFGTNMLEIQSVVLHSKYYSWEIGASNSVHGQFDANIFWSVGEAAGWSQSISILQEEDGLKLEIMPIYSDGKLL